MEEQIIGFELAKLVKEKGFNWEIRTYFDFKKFGIKPVEFFNKLNANNFSHWDFNLNKKINAGYISAPTQSLLQKWLREKHNIHIQILPYNHKYLISILKYGQNGSNPNFDNEFDTYEEALETGLFEALKLI